MSVRIVHGDMREALARLGPFSACVTDPPYHFSSIVKRFGAANAAPAKAGKTGAYARASRGFMGKEWDGGDIAFQPETWTAVGAALRPGAHLVAFAGTKGFHRMICAIEDAGFEIRDTLAWLYGSGFPKSHTQKGEWEGWGTALKPAYEPIVLARWPMAGKTVAANLAEHRCGALNVDACRIETDTGEQEMMRARSGGAMGADPANSIYGTGYKRAPAGHPVGRWPANVVHDGSEEVVRAFPDTGGGAFPASRGAGGIGNNGHRGQSDLAARATDSGSAARFFYSAKADATDRLQSKHPTVKPVDLMRWLVRLVTPKGGHILDPFAGSGTTGMAAMAEGFDCTLIEREAEYVADIERRVAHVSGHDAPLFEARQ